MRMEWCDAPPGVHVTINFCSARSCEIVGASDFLEIRYDFFLQRMERDKLAYSDTVNIHALDVVLRRPLIPPTFKNLRLRSCARL